MKMRCEIHDVPLVCFCPACRGEATSKRKAASSRLNGARGGRPPALNAAKLARLQKLRESGATLQEIADKLHISTSTVQRVIAQKGRAEVKHEQG